jgi:hypothetical protein
MFLIAPAACLTRASVRPRDAEHGEREGDPKPRYSEHIDEEWLDYVMLDCAQSIYAALQKLWSDQPVMLRGSPLVAGLVGRWGFKRLVRTLSEHHVINGRLPQCCACHLPVGTSISGRVSLFSHLHVHVAPQVTAIGTKHQDFPALCSATNRNRFIECNAAKNVYGSMYHVREPETQLLHMSFPEFVNCAERWKMRNIFLKVSRGAMDALGPAASGVAW